MSKQLTLRLENDVLFAGMPGWHTAIHATSSTEVDKAAFFDRCVKVLQSVRSVTVDGLLRVAVLECFQKAPRAMTMDELLSFVSMPRGTGWQQRVSDTIEAMVLDGTLVAGERGGPGLSGVTYYSLGKGEAIRG